MRLTKCWLGVFLMAVTVASPIVVAGCAERTTGRVYDPYYGDYHGWSDSEVVFYRQWVVETLRPYRELRALPPEQQWEYRNCAPPPRGSSLRIEPASSDGKTKSRRSPFTGGPLFFSSAPGSSDYCELEPVTVDTTGT